MVVGLLRFVAVEGDVQIKGNHMIAHVMPPRALARYLLSAFPSHVEDWNDCRTETLCGCHQISFHYAKLDLAVDYLVRSSGPGGSLFIERIIVERAGAWYDTPPVADWDARVLRKSGDILTVNELVMLEGELEYLVSWEGPHASIGETIQSFARRGLGVYSRKTPPDWSKRDAVIAQAQGGKACLQR